MYDKTLKVTTVNVLAQKTFPKRHRRTEVNLM